MTNITITNKSKTPRGLPGKKLLDPNASMEVTPDDMENFARYPVVISWFESGELVEGDAAPDMDADEDETEAEEKARLVEELAAFGIEKTTRTNVENLRAALAEAQEAS